MNEKNASSEKPMNRHMRFSVIAKEYADQTMKLFHKFQKDHVDTAAVEKERQNLARNVCQRLKKACLPNSRSKNQRSS